MVIMSEFSDIVKQGYLKAKHQKLGHWQKKWVVLRCASSRGPNRLERYEDEMAASLNTESKVIFLSDLKMVMKSQAENRLHVIVLYFTRGTTKKFAADSDMQASEWLKVLHKYTTGQTDPRDIFHVYLLPNINTELNGEYLLQVMADSILLREPSGQMALLITWKLNTLRSYGCDSNKFTFEAGRSSETGEGIFIFTTVEAEQIYQSIHSAAQALVTVQNMNRRQQTGWVPDRGVMIVSKPLTERSKFVPETKPSSQSRNPPITESRSFSVSLTRPPMPLPHDASGADSKADVPSLYTEPVEGRKVHIPDESTDNSSRPLPPSPADSQQVNNDTYIYEEKGLTPQFRAFLQTRKDVYCYSALQQHN